MPANTAPSTALPDAQDFFSNENKKQHPQVANLAASVGGESEMSTVTTPASDIGPSASTSASASDDDGEAVTTSTLTTTTSKGEESKASTVQFQVIGASGLAHRVGRDGQIHLKPVAPRSKSRKKRMRAVISFRPRNSHFDRFNESSSKDQFRGFFTLFWLSLALFVLNTSYTSFDSTGKVLSMTFATLFSRDAWILALSDGLLIASLFMCVPFAKVCKRGWVRYWPTAVVFQHLWQGSMLGLVIKWARYREWPWVQSGFFVLHTLSMMMKIHSYMTVNGNLADVYHKLKRTEKMLEERVAEIEGHAAGSGDQQLEAAWMKAARHARTNAGFTTDSSAFQHWADIISQRGSSNQRLKKGQELCEIPADLPAETGEHKTLSREEHMRVHKEQQERENADRKERDASNRKESESTDASLAGHQIRDPHPLSSHQDSLIADLAREIEVLREDLLSERPSADLLMSPDITPQATVMWPANVSYYNFWDYLLVPTLVYELSYPRTHTIRPLYVLEKVLATFGTFFVIYVITEHWIMPFTPTTDTPLLRTFLQLAVPMMINYLLIFYIMFECICNTFAELTCFADREFYLDWWNATSMDVFSRKWNKPVHSFLLKHVYASTIAAWGLSKSMAMFLTFLLSSLVHELVMAIVSGKIRFYLFAAQMVQLPLIFISQIPFIKRNETLGNMIFWVGLMAGFPLLNIGYLVY